MTTPTATKPDELKSRVLRRYLPVCTTEGCDWNPKTEDVPQARRPETSMREGTALKRSSDHAIAAGHVYVKPVKVRKVRQVIREEIVE